MNVRNLIITMVIISIVFWVLMFFDYRKARKHQKSLFFERDDKDKPNNKQGG